jgi:hypothetical protein
MNERDLLCRCRCDGSQPIREDEESLPRGAVLIAHRLKKRGLVAFVDHPLGIRVCTTSLGLLALRVCP